MSKVIPNAAPIQKSYRVTWWRNVLAVLSFAIYAVAVVQLDQPYRAPWPVEAYNAFPSAISFNVYGAPLGTVIDNVSNVFADTYREGGKTSVQQAFERTTGGQASGGRALQIFDGIGPGYALFASVSMLIFGPYISSVVYAFLLLSALTSLIYALRFQDDRLLLVPLQYLALTTMLLTSMATHWYMAGQIPIGGYRAFILVALLPGMHLYFEVCDGTDGSGRFERRLLLLLLAPQVTVLVLAIFVRASVAYMLLPAGVAWLWRLWSERLTRLMLYRKAALAVFAALATAGAVALALPAYFEAGRGFGNFWHRAFISLGAHPEFPFGDMAQQTECPQLQYRMTAGIVDRNAHCTWFAYHRDWPIRDLDAAMFGPEYEHVMRHKLRLALMAYPRQAFELYFYYKPLMIAQNLRGALKLSAAPNPGVAWLAGAQWVVFIAFVVLSAISARPPATWRISLVLAAGFLLSMAPGLLAWSNPATTADTIFFMYCLIGFAVAAAAGFLVRLADRGRSLPQTA